MIQFCLIWADRILYYEKFDGFILDKSKPIAHYMDNINGRRGNLVFGKMKISRFEKKDWKRLKNLSWNQTEDGKIWLWSGINWEDSSWWYLPH